MVPFSFSVSSETLLNLIFIASFSATRLSVTDVVLALALTT